MIELLRELAKAVTDVAMAERDMLQLGITEQRIQEYERRVVKEFDLIRMVQRCK